MFVKEIVPRAAIAWLARRMYDESYVALSMSHGDQVEHPRWKVWRASAAELDCDASSL